MSTLSRATVASRPTGRPVGRDVRKFRPDIEGLRAVAVTLVVLAHLGLGFPGGYIGVDVFFVISGFLITRQLFGEVERTDSISFRRFYARRVRRILPAAAVVIVGSTLACWKWDSPLQVRSDALDGLYSAFSGINWRLAAGGTNYFSLSAAPSPFQHFWSLAVEEQFYFLWPMLLLVAGVLLGRRYGRRKTVVWTLLLIMAASLFLSIKTTPLSPSWAYFGTQTRAWELALGALVAVTADVWTRMPPALASQMSWLGLGLIGFSALAFTGSTEFPGTAVIVPVAGSACVIAGGCPGWPRGAEFLLKRRPMQFLGKTSYSWYLVHWPMLMILPLALSHALTLTDKWLVLFGSLGIAVLMHYLIEQPIRVQPSLARRPAVTLALGCALVAASVGTAAAVYSGVTIPGSGGAPARRVAADGLLGVHKAVAAGTRLMRLPSNVRPSLARAFTDRPFTTRTCLVPDTEAAAPPNRRCTFGDLASKRVMAVVGDSHANEWTPAIDAFAKAHHWKIILYAKAACSPGLYPNYVDPLTNRVYTQCNKWRRRVWARLRKLKPEVVLVASELRTIDIDPSGMVTAIRFFEASGAKVIYLEDTPNPEAVGPIPDCLARNPDSVQSCSLSRTAPATRLNGFIQRRVEADAARRAGAAVIDPTSWFCTGSLCPAVINDMIVYADSSHTTATYARWLAPVLGAALRKAIR